MPILTELIPVAAGLAWLVVFVAAISNHRAMRTAPEQAPPPGNSDWYLVMQAALWAAFLLMLAQSLLVWATRGSLTALEAVATASFAIGFVVTSIGFAITVVRWRRAKRAQG